MQLVKGQSSAAPDLNFEQAYQDAVLNEVRSVITEYFRILTKIFSLHLSDLIYNTPLKGLLC